MNTASIEVTVCGEDPLVATTFSHWLGGIESLRVRKWERSSQPPDADVALLICTHGSPGAGRSTGDLFQQLPLFPRVLLAPRCTPAAVLQAITCEAQVLVTHAQAQSQQQLAGILVTAARGEPLVSPRSYLSSFPVPGERRSTESRRHSPQTSLRLTERELELACALTCWLDYEQIATQHHISVATVKYHVRELLAKTGLANRQQLAEYFLQELPYLALQSADAPIRYG